MKNKKNNIGKFSVGVTLNHLEKDRQEKELGDKIDLIVAASWFILPIVGLLAGYFIVYVINP